MTGEHLAKFEGWPSKPWIARLHQLQLRLPLVARHLLTHPAAAAAVAAANHHIILFPSPNIPTHHHHLQKEDAATPFSRTLVVGCCVTRRRRRRHKGSFGLVWFRSQELGERKQAVRRVGSVRKAAAK